VRAVDGVVQPMCRACAAAFGAAAFGAASDGVEEPCSSCFGTGCADCDYTGERIAELRYGGM